MALVQQRSQRRLAPAAGGALGSYQPPSHYGAAPGAASVTMNVRPQLAPQGAQQPAPTKAELQMAKAQELMRKLNRPDLHAKQPPPENDKKEKKERPRLSNYDMQQLVNPNLSKMKGAPALSQKIQRQSSGMTCQQNGASQPPQHAAQFQQQNRPSGQHGPEASPQLNKNTSLPVGRRNAAPLGASGQPNRSTAAGTRPRRSGSNVDQLLRASLEDLQADSRNCRSLCNSNSSSPSVSRCNSVDATNDGPFSTTGEATNGDGAAAAAARGRSRLGPSRQGSLVSGSAASAAAAAVGAGAGAPAGVARVSGAPQPVALSAAAARKSLQNLRKNPAAGGGGGVAGPDFSSSAPAGALAGPRLAAGQQAPPAARGGKGTVARTQSLDCSSGAHLGKMVLKSRAASVDMAGVAAQAAAAVGAAAAGTAAATAAGAGGAAGGPPVGGKVPKSFSATGAASFSGKASPPVARVARSLSSLSGELAASSAASGGISGIGSIAAAAAATAALDDEVCSVEEIRSAFYKAKGGGKGILGLAMRGLSQLSGMLGGGGGLTENVLGREFSAIEKKYFVMMDQELGAGQFGVTRMAKCRQTGKQFACKSICKANLKSKSDLEDIRREVSMLETLRPNPNIARLEEVFEDEEGVHLVMELCVGGELFDKIKEKKRYEEREAVPVMRTILDVLAFCHMRGIVHRDIKPENVLLTSPDSITECKLIDFGVATVVKPGAKPLCDFVGSPFYVAPEVIEGSYGIPADVWSAGVVLYVLISGVPPFWARTDAGIMKAIKEAKPCFKGEAWRDVSLEGVDLIRRMLTRDPKKRLTARAALEHSWFSVWND
ncbi:unnamed protein product [Closterium sp. NIES-65]|nr:unnamed protein product [Closterium sp. NIES-65]